MLESKHHGKSYSTLSKSYKNFMEVLVRRKVKNPGLHASFYFDAFWLKCISINKASVVGRKLYDEDSGTFVAWREHQRSLGLLDWIENTERLGITYRPGKVTIRYLNALIIDSGQLATIGDVEASEEKLLKVTEGLQKQITEMQRMLNVVTSDYLAKYPPNTTERKLRLLENIKNGKTYLEEDRRAPRHEAPKLTVLND